MTKEEAAEIVLAGPVWEPCLKCSSLATPPEALFTVRFCEVCRDMSFTLANRCREAYELLGLELPVYQPQTLTFQVRETVIHGRALTAEQIRAEYRRTLWQTLGNLTIESVVPVAETSKSEDDDDT